MNELIVGDLGGHTRALVACLSLFGTHDTTLAQYVAVLLAGDFFRHLKHHLQQRIQWQLLRTVKEHSRLADVFDYALVPCVAFIDSVTHRRVQFKPSCPRHPGWTFFSSMTAADAGFRFGVFYALGAAHGGPVVLVFGRAQQANLVIFAVGATPRPRKFVRTPPHHKNIHEFLRHEGYFRTGRTPTHGSSSPEPAGLNRLPSCTGERWRGGKPCEYIGVGFGWFSGERPSRGEIGLLGCHVKPPFR